MAEQEYSLEFNDTEIPEGSDDNSGELDHKTAQEEQARQEGWVPFDEWDGSPGDWVDAPEFNVRGSLMKRIQKQSREIADLKRTSQEQIKALKELGDHNRKVAEYEYQRAIKDLRAKKKEALDEGDSDQVLSIDDQLDQLKEAQAENKKLASQENQDTGSQNAPDPKTAELADYMQTWASKPENAWFVDNVAMRNTALELGDKILARDPNIDLDELFSEVSKQTKKAFGKAKSPSEAAVDDSGDASGAARAKASGNKSGGKKYSSSRLSSEQLKIAKTLAASGAFQDDKGSLSEKQQIEIYAQQLGEMGELD